MKKIVSLFKRDYSGTRQVYDEVVEGAEWVIAGEGVATRKWDGTSCLVRDGKLYKRYDAKHGKTPPPGFEPAQEPDEQTGHWPGWVPVGIGREDMVHRDTFLRCDSFPDGTYELCGPKINGNNERLKVHQLYPHGLFRCDDAPRTFAELRAWFDTGDGVIEGVVWHHPDGRMVKIKRRDFGLAWPIDAKGLKDLG
jgi:hypothetical protein